MQEKHGISRREFMQMLKQQAIYSNGILIESFNSTVKPGDQLELRQ